MRRVTLTKRGARRLRAPSSYLDPDRIQVSMTPTSSEVRAVGWGVQHSFAGCKCIGRMKVASNYEGASHFYVEIYVIPGAPSYYGVLHPHPKELPTAYQRSDFEHCELLPPPKRALNAKLPIGRKRVLSDEEKRRKASVPKKKRARKKTGMDKRA